MKSKLMLGLGFLAFAIGIGCQSPKTKLTAEEVESMVAEAYVHCFPIVENYKAIYFYGVLEASPVFTPMNTLKHESRLYTPEDKAVVSANNDTYYSTGILDLRAEPVVFKVPEAKDRYYVFQLISQTTDNFNYIGTRLTGTKAGTYAVTSPKFEGKLPDGVIQIKAPSDFVCVAGRTAVNDEDEADKKEALAFQSQYEIGSMSKFFPDFKANPVEALTFPVYNEATVTTPAFFSILNFLLPHMKLSDEEAAIIKNFESIGVHANGAFTFLNENPDYKEAFDNGIKKGIAQIDELAKGMGTMVNGWSLWPVMDAYFGNNYTLRSQVAKVAIYANCPVEAYYPLASLDSNGKQLNGANSYFVTFPADALPPAKFFWSLTMYDNATRLMVHNELDRYSIGDRTKGLTYNSDGSLTLYFGHKKPIKGPGNWLPAPEGDFNMLMRLYGPKEEVINKKWAPPAIIKMNK